MNIRTKERLATITVFVVIAIIATTIWWAYAEVREATRQRQQTSEIARGVSDLRVVTIDYLMNRQGDAREQWRAVSERVDHAIAEYQFSGPVQEKILADLRAKKGLTQGIFEKLTAPATSDTSYSPNNEFRQRHESVLLDYLVIGQQDSIADAFRLSDLAADRITNAQQRMMRLTLVGLLLISLIKVATSWLVNRNVLEPLDKMKLAMQEVAAGKWSARSGISSDDEIGDMARSFDAMAAQLQVTDTALRGEIAEREKTNTTLETAGRDLAISNTDLSKFACIVAHDLQEQLRVVTSCLRLIEQRLAEQQDDESRELMNFATDGALRMKKMIEGILVYSRVNTHGQEFELVDSAAAVAEALDMLATQIIQTRAEVTVQLLPMVNADQTQLVQLLQNLISNALKYCRAKVPQVCIAAQRDRHDWRFSVSDNGIGIAPQYRASIFSGMFKRLHTQREYPGIGIGLAISRRIVERHGGKIWVDATASGGSIFWFTLPCAVAGINAVVEHP